MLSTVKSENLFFLTYPQSEYRPDDQKSDRDRNGSPCCCRTKAKKLKTLIVKSASVKKALKKNPSKYGLSKKVKIK